MNRLLILTGASGSGKTAIVGRINERARSHLVLLNFDSIGVPELSEMEKLYGTPEGWQKAKTFEWVKRISEEYLPKSDVIFEGQMRMVFILEALQSFGLSSSLPQTRVVLLDCSDEVRKNRLTYARKQPGLATDQMMNWAKFLRNEATNFGIETLDTSALSVDNCVSSLLDSFKKECSNG